MWPRPEPGVNVLPIPRTFQVKTKFISNAQITSDAEVSANPNEGCATKSARVPSVGTGRLAGLNMDGWTVVASALQEVTWRT